jgi:tetratricopeptide (TPR) repeat protein
MRGYQKAAVILASAALLISVPATGRALAADNPVSASAVSAGSCSVAGGRDASHNTVTCNFGLTPEEFKQATEAAVASVVPGEVARATGPLLDRIVAIGKTLGVTEEAAKTLLRIVGEETNVPDDKLAEALTKVANDYKRLQAMAAALKPANPIAMNLVKQARSAIEDGHFELAHQLLRQATQAQIAAADEARRLRDQAQTAADADMLGAADSTAAEAEVAFTERNYPQAVSLFKQAADYVPPGHDNVRADYAERQANTLFRQGDERGDNAALHDAVEVYRQILVIHPQEREPLDWARIQTNLGNALWALGQRDSGTAQIEEAITNYRAALLEIKREQIPLEWAVIQNNLGNALLTLGERSSGTERLEEAISAYRATLEETTRERTPLGWARAQNNLGNALLTLGRRDGGTDRLEQAISAYRAALEADTRQQAPRDWAIAQNNLGLTLAALGERERGTTRLEQAVETYRAALEETTRERMPIAWSILQNNLGNALKELGQREPGTARLEQAVAAYRAALEETTRQRAPFNWSVLQNNLGDGLRMLGEQ